VSVAVGRFGCFIVGSDRTACAVCMPRDASLRARKVALGKFKMCNGSHTAEPPMLGVLTWNSSNNCAIYLAGLTGKI
jgi:hypothetical protein